MEQPDTTIKTLNDNNSWATPIVLNHDFIWHFYTIYVTVMTSSINQSDICNYRKVQFIMIWLGTEYHVSLIEGTSLIYIGELTSMNNFTRFIMKIEVTRIVAPGS